MTIERQNYFAPGLWNACCDGCDAKLKSNELRKDWQGFMKCTRCWEPRHPQDFVRSRPGAEPAPLPWTRKCVGDDYTFITPCPAPVPTFTAVVDTVDPYTVHFTNTTYAPETYPNTYVWDLGDETTSTAWAFSHTFEAGTFEVTLTAENTCTAGIPGIGTSLTFIFESAGPTSIVIDLDALALADLAANPPNGSITALSSSSFPGVLITGATLYNYTSSGTTSPYPGPTSPGTIGFIQNRNPDESTSPRVTIYLDPPVGGVTQLEFDLAKGAATLMRLYVYSTHPSSPFTFEFATGGPSWVFATNTLELPSVSYGDVTGLEWESAPVGGFSPAFALANITLSVE